MDMSDPLAPRQSELVGVRDVHWWASDPEFFVHFGCSVLGFRPQILCVSGMLSAGLQIPNYLCVRGAQFWASDPKLFVCQGCSVLDFRRQILSVSGCSVLGFRP